MRVGTTYRVGLGPSDRRKEYAKKPWLQDNA